jgi:hypothetical protein
MAGSTLALVAALPSRWLPEPFVAVRDAHRQDFVLVAIVIPLTFLLSLLLVKAA